MGRGERGTAALHSPTPRALHNQPWVQVKRVLQHYYFPRASSPCKHTELERGVQFDRRKHIRLTVWHLPMHRRKHIPSLSVAYSLTSCDILLGACSTLLRMPGTLAVYLHIRRKCKYEGKAGVKRVPNHILSGAQGTSMNPRKGRGQKGTKALPKHCCGRQAINCMAWHGGKTNQ